MSETQGVEIPKTMLILKSNATALGVVETFLRNRGWKIYSTANLKEALVQIVSNKPSYVLISVDHANKKVRALPKLLSQALPVAIIAFAENQNSTSFKYLNESATDYRVYPPVTGPAIERCVNKYLKDQQTRMTVQSANDTFRAESKDGTDVISVRGGGSDNIEIKGGGDLSGDAGRLFAQLMGDEGASVAAATTTNTGKADTNQVFAQPLYEDDDGSARTQGHGPGFDQTYVQKGTAGTMDTLVPPTSMNDDLGSAQSSSSGGPNYSGQQQGADGQNHAAYQQGDEGPEGRATQQGAANSPGDPQADGNPFADAPSEGLGSREYRRRQAAAGWKPMDDDNSVERVRGNRERSDVNQTLIARGTQKSLEESAVIGDGVVQEKAQESTSAACIIVESERFSGYLVAVMGKNRKIDQTFINNVKTKLFKFLKENGEDVAEGESMDIKIKQVDFEPWALEYAEFLRKSVHEGNEVAMAFFPRRPIKAILEESSHQDMAKIDLEHLQGDRQVEFDLYVYLPTNNKYVLYTPKGGVFYNKQMDRLKKQGVTHMHVQKTAAAAISRYHAQNYLNDMIEDHEQKQELAAKIRAA